MFYLRNKTEKKTNSKERPKRNGLFLVGHFCCHQQNGKIFQTRKQFAALFHLISFPFDKKRLKMRHKYLFEHSQYLLIGLTSSRNREMKIDFQIALCNVRRARQKQIWWFFNFMQTIDGFGWRQNRTIRCLHQHLLHNQWGNKAENRETLRSHTQPIIAKEVTDRRCAHDWLQWSKEMEKKT